MKSVLAFYAYIYFIEKVQARSCVKKPVSQVFPRVFFPRETTGAVHIITKEIIACNLVKLPFPESGSLLKDTQVFDFRTLVLNV